MWQAALEQVHRPQLTSDGICQLSGNLLEQKGKLRSFEENLISGLLLKLLSCGAGAWGVWSPLPEIGIRPKAYTAG